jgi:hypothetical protein
MTATIHPFRKSSVGGPRGRASGREARESFPADLLQQSEALREARRKLFECWAIRAESRRIQRGYEERQQRLEELLDRIDGGRGRA